MATKNLGQVSGLWIGTSAPSNTSLIWYDSTPAIRCHKVYSSSLSAWVVLDQSSISSITYTELRNLARGTGLTQGSWYKITDQGNILALAITTTKVQYVDVNNNFVIDDLAASATYAVTSSNLLIDDISGVWDADNNLLKFSFKETAHDGNTDNDFVFGKKQRNGVWSLAKYKLSSFISSVAGNSITWNKGFFFNFLSALRGQYDVSGGVVSKDTYDTQKAALQQSIDNVSSSNQAILNSAKNYTDGKTAANEVYSKVLPSSPTSGTAIDIAKGDTLSGIITKIQRWIAQFKVATGIKVSQSFAPSLSLQDINNNDTVDSALRKVQKQINHLNEGIPDNSITRSKMSSKTYGYREYLSDQRSQREICDVYPGMISTNYYNERNPYNGRYLRVCSPVGWSDIDCALQPSKVIMLPNQNSEPSQEAVKSYIIADTGIKLTFDVSMDAVVPDREHLCVFEFYWQSKQKVFVKFTYVNLNW